MTIAVGDILQLNVRALYDAQDVRNIYHYTVDGVVGTPELDELAGDWWIQLNVALRALAVPSLVYQEINIESLTGDLDFAVFPIPAATSTGTRPGAQASAAAQRALSLRLTVPTRAIRSGWKRFAGFEGDADVGNFGVLLAATVTRLQTVGNLLIAPLTLEATSGSVTVIPAILGRRDIPSPGTLITVPPNGYTVAPYETTQNTRKRGRGS